jgi:hypothetical protein
MSLLLLVGASSWQAATGIFDQADVNAPGCLTSWSRRHRCHAAAAFDDARTVALTAG